MKPVFVDTNVLIYARDVHEGPKHTRAAEWLFVLDRQGRGRLNLQVMNEFTRWALTRRRGKTLAEVRAEVDLLRAWGGSPLSEADVELAWRARERFGFQWFDCLLLGAAAVSGCGWFLSEDMVHETRFEGVTVISPFEVAPHEI